MRTAPTRNKAAAGLFAMFGLGAGVGAIVTGSLLFLAIGCVAFLAAAAALRDFPIDRNW